MVSGWSLFGMNVFPGSRIVWRRRPFSFYYYYTWAKEKGLEVVLGIIRDVFVILPTGFGKSACFQCLKKSEP